MRKKITNVITFKPSNAHSGHYICVNKKTTGIAVNVHAYVTIERYKNEIDKEINKFLKKLKDKKCLTYSKQKK